jgi:hypothetical protein
MTIVIRGIEAESEFRARVLAEVESVLDKARMQPTTVTIVFTDVNGPKGGMAIRLCRDRGVAAAGHAANRAARRDRTARVRQGREGVREEACPKPLTARSVDGPRSTTWPSE